MRIFLIWLVVIACSVANGWFFSDFGSPEKFVFMFCASAVCATVLLIHRRITRDWKAYKDPWIEGFRFPVFRITLFFSVFALIILFVLHEASATLIVICVTIAIASFIAYVRERDYTDNWI